MKTKQTGYIVDFAVRGFGEFPLDMLRYDSAWPATESDSYRMRDEGKRVVFLTMWCRNGTGPTVGRWESFTWRVLRQDELEDARLSQSIGVRP